MRTCTHSLPYLAVLAAVFSSPPAPAGATVRPPGPEAVLSTLEKRHPRLILKDERLARLMRLRGADRTLKKAFEDVLRRADAVSRKAPLSYQKRGPRLLHVSRECLRRTYALGLAWRITRKKLYMEKARENLLAVCAFRDWNPSHFLDTAEMSHAVGIGYDWFYSALDEETRRAIRAGLIEKGLKPGLKAYKGRGAWWVRSSFNWNQVCNSGLVIGALAIAETDPRYAKTIVPSAVNSLPRAIATYAPDGAWPEGPGYWVYATNYTVFGIAALKSALGTDFGLSELPGLSEAGMFPIHLSGPSGMWLHFADVGENSRRRNIPVLFWLAEAYGRPVLAGFERAMMERRSAGPLDVIWYVPPPPGRALTPPLDRRFGGPVEIAVFRSAWDDPNALFVGVKAGYNQVNHGHLDLGNFELEALGVRWACDLGGDDYNLPGYWQKGRGGRRWSYYRLGSLSHNVPLLDNQNQEADAKARFLKFKSSPSRAHATVELTGAYRNLARRVVRGVAVLDRRHVLVQDEFDLKKPCELAWGMTTRAEINIERRTATLRQDGKMLRARILAPAGASFAVESAEQEPPQRQNEGVRRLVVRLKSQGGLAVVAVHFVPAWRQGAVKEPRLVPLAGW